MVRAAGSCGAVRGGRSSKPGISTHIIVYTIWLKLSNTIFEMSALMGLAIADLVLIKAIKKHLICLCFEGAFILTLIGQGKWYISILLACIFSKALPIDIF